MRRALLIALVLLLVVSFAGSATAAPPDEEPVTIAVAFGGGELDAFEAELASLDGIDVEVVVYDAAAAPEIITGENPPDLIIVPQPGLLVDLADHLVPIDSMTPEPRLRAAFGDYLIDVASADGAVVGAPVKLGVKSLVWYKPSAFADGGYAIPQTFTELVALSDQMVANGQTPWCHWMFSGGATGWLGTDWIEDLLLSAEGPAVYDAWVAHDVVFQDPRVEQAFTQFMFMVNTDGYTFLRDFVTGIFFGFNAYPLADEECLMHRQASFFASFITGEGFDVADFDTFGFPPVDPAHDDAVMGGGDYVAALDQSNHVKRVVQFLTSPQFGRSVIAPQGADLGWILPHARFNLVSYGSELSRSWAELAKAAILADQFRFDGSDLMPPVVGSWADEGVPGAFWTGIVDLLDGIRTLPEVLADIDAAWPTP